LLIIKTACEENTRGAGCKMAKEWVLTNNAKMHFTGIYLVEDLHITSALKINMSTASFGA